MREDNLGNNNNIISKLEIITLDKKKFSDNYIDNVEFNTETHSGSGENLNHQLLDYFSIRLSLLEESYSRKEIDITSLMFKLHYITMTSKDIKSHLQPKPIDNCLIKNRGNEENLNCSKMSSMSKRSESYSRTKIKDFMQKNHLNDKMGLLSPKVAINIMCTPDKDHKSSNDKSAGNKISNKMTKIVKDSNVENLIRESKTTPGKKMVNQSPLIPKDKPKILSEDEKMQIQKEVNFKKGNSENILKKNTNSTKKNVNQLVNLNNTKTKDVPLKFSNSTDKVKVTIIKKNFDKVIKNKENDLSKFIKSNDPKDNSSKDNLFSKQITSKANFKFQPKNNRNICNDNFLSDEFITTDVKLKKFSISFKDIFDTNLLSGVLKFLKLNDRISFKNVSHNNRNTFINYQINELSSKLSNKKLEENPLYHIVLPKELEDKILNQNLILSDYLNIYNEDPCFNNLVKILYIIVISDSSTKEKSISQFINDLEIFLEVNRDCKTKNIYKLFRDINYNIRNKYSVYEKLKDLFSENSQIFKLKGLSEEFMIFSDFLQIVEQFISKESNMEVVIDMEIYEHKIEILKKFSLFK